MNSIAIPALSPKSLIADLFERQRTLAAFGLALFVLALPLLAMTWLDPRLLDSGRSPWVKPVKFMVSMGLFSVTSAWFFGYVRAERRGSRLMRWTVTALIASATFELFWIIWQAGHGVDSHFNVGRPIDAIMFGLMGVFALVLTGSVLPLAWEIARRPAPGLPGDYVAAVVAGLVLTFLLGTGAGIVMSVNGGHAVGAEGQGLPLFGWNRIGGDIRVAHFLGIHAEQIIPAAAALIASFAAPLRQRLLIAGILLYTALTLFVLAQAMAGRPLLPV